MAWWVVIGHYPARVLAAKAPYHLGEISYSDYLLHMIPLYGSTYLLSRLGVGGGLLQVAVALTTVLGTYVAALAAHRWIEKPGIRLGAYLTRNEVKRTPALNARAARRKAVR